MKLKAEAVSAYAAILNRMNGLCQIQMTAYVNGFCTGEDNHIQ